MAGCSMQMGVKYCYFRQYLALSRKGYKIGPQLLWNAYRILYAIY